MIKKVLLDIICNDKTERLQKYNACRLVANRIGRIKGVYQVAYTGNDDCDLTVLANWNEDKLQDRLKELDAVGGIKKVTLQTLIAA